MLKEDDIAPNWDLSELFNGRERRLKTKKVEAKKENRGLQIRERCILEICI